VPDSLKDGETVTDGVTEYGPQDAGTTFVT
jgi:hypothetical protein